MDWLSLVGLLPQILSVVSSVQTKVKAGGNLLTLAQNIAPDITPVLTDIGKALFPKVDPAKAAAAAIDTVFDTDGTTWVQTALNTVAHAGLTVDGSYGAKTRTAVEAYQKAHSLKVDGWAGPKTSAALGVELSKVAA